MEIEVLLFASVAEAFGSPSVTIQVPAAISVSELLESIGTKYPPLRERLTHARVAIDREFRDACDPVPANAEIAIIPPVSGG